MRCASLSVVLLSAGVVVLLTACTQGGAVQRRPARLGDEPSGTSCAKAISTSDAKPAPPPPRPLADGASSIDERVRAQPAPSGSSSLRDQAAQRSAQTVGLREMLGRAIERGDWQGYWQAFIRLAYAAPEAGDVRLDALLPLINSASDWANPAESSYLKPETRLHATLAALEYLSTNGPADQRSEALLAAAWLVEGLEGEPEALPLWRRLAASYPGSAAAGTARSRVWQAENLQEGQLLPDVAWTDASGETFRLRMLRGVTVFYFWGSECTPCEAEIGHLKALSESWAGDRKSVV